MKKWFLILIACLTAMTVIVACKSDKDKAATEATEKAMELATGKDVELSSDGKKVTIEGAGERAEISYGATEWPNDMPSDVPKFTASKVKHVTRSNYGEVQNWMVIFEAVGLSDINAYEASLKSAGFQVSSMKMPEGGSITGEKGKLIVSCIYSKEQFMVSAQKQP